MLRLKLDFSSPLILKTDGSKLPAAEISAVFCLLEINVFLKMRLTEQL